MSLEESDFGTSIIFFGTISTFDETILYPFFSRFSAISAVRAGFVEIIKSSSSLLKSSAQASRASLNKFS